MTEYWSNYRLPSMEQGYELALRAKFAWDLIHHFGVISAKIDGEDSAGRAKLVLNTPQELVDRCFDIADLFIKTAEDRGEIREIATTDEEIFKRAGELDNIRSNHAWGRVKTETVSTTPTVSSK